MKTQLKNWSLGVLSASLFTAGCLVDKEVVPTGKSEGENEGESVESVAQAATLPANYRVAYDHDGNYNDEDDWASSASGIAQLSKFLGTQKTRLVHFSYNGFYSPSTSGWDAKQALSVTGAAARWGFTNTAVFKNRVTDTNAAEDSLTNAINASSGNNPLYLIAGGPMELIWRAMNNATPAINTTARQWVQIVSHSAWNEQYDIFQLFNSYHSDKGMPNLATLGANGPQIIAIKAQQGLDPSHGKYITGQACPIANALWDPHEWMAASADVNVNFIWGRLTAVTRPDMSDSGMTYFLFTGNEYVIPNYPFPAGVAYYDPSNVSSTHTLKRLLGDNIMPPKGDRNVFAIEAEHFNGWSGNYVYAPESPSTTGRKGLLVGAKANDLAQTMDRQFNVLYTKTGKYVVTTRYFDTTGTGNAAVYDLRINGVVADTWTANATTQAWQLRTKSTVTITLGNTVRVTCINKGTEKCKIDNLLFTWKSL